MGRFLFLLLCTSPLFAQSAEEHLRQIDKSMMQVKQEPMRGITPEAIYHLLPSFKDALVEVAGNVLKSSSIKAAPSAIQRAIQRRLPVAKAPREPEMDDKYFDTPLAGYWGANVRAHVIALSAEYLQVGLEYSIQCGFDEVVLLYHREATQWKQVLRWQSDFSSVEKAFGDFVSTALVHSNPRVVHLLVVHGLPWCTSNYSAYKVDLLEMISGSTKPKVVWHGEFGYMRFSEPKLKVTPDGFEIRAEAHTVESTVLFKKNIRRFKIEGNTVQRIQPIALNGRDFVDEWLQSDWIDAASWSDASSLAALQQLHQQYQPSDKISLEYGPVRACSDNPKLFQVQINKVLESSNQTQPIYFQITQQTNGYLLQAISTTADNTCRGANLIPLP